MLLCDHAGYTAGTPRSHAREPDVLRGAYGLFGATLLSRCDSIQEQVGLDGFDDELTAALPGGLRQKLALGCALLHEPQKVASFLGYIARLKGIEASTARRRTRAWLERLGLESVQNKRRKELSKGMQQKVAPILGGSGGGCVQAKRSWLRQQ